MAHRIRPILQPAPHEFSPIPSCAPWETVSELLESAFDVLQHAWAREFLFDSNSLTDAQILSSPLQMNHAITMSAAGSFEAFGPSADCHANLLIVPAFCCESYTALYFVEGHITDNIPREILENFVVHPRRFIRAVRNDITGALTCVVQGLRDEDVEVGFYMSESTVKCMRTNLRFNATKFFSAFDISTGEIDFSALEDALTGTIVTSSTTRCILCSATYDDACSCKMSFQPARNPLSFEHNTVHLLPFLGDFHDIAKFTTYTTSPKTSALIDGYSKSVSGAAFGVADNLHKWALCSLISGQRIRPFRLNLPNHIALLAARDDFSRTSAERDQFPLDSPPSEDGKAIGNATVAIQEQINCTEMALPAAESEHILDATQPEPSPFTSASDVIDSLLDCDSEEATQQTLVFSNSYSANDISDLGSNMPAHSYQHNSFTIRETDFAHAFPAIVSTSTNARQALDVPKRPRQPVKIAPAPQALTAEVNTQNCDGGTPLSEGAAYIAKLEADYEARIELRKIRKRQAAARSNARRSQRRLQQRESSTATAKM